MTQSSESDKQVGKVGWVPIEKWGDRYRHRFCETERHRGRFVRAAAVAVALVVEGGGGFGPGGYVWGMCASCLEAAQAADFPREPLR